MEAMLAMTVLAMAALGAIGSMAQTMALEEDTRERVTAVHVAQRMIDEITSYEWVSSFQEVIDHWSDSSVAKFTVPELEAPHADSPGGAAPWGGMIDIDATDPLRVQFTVTI